MRWILLILAFSYNWDLCYSEFPYDFYVQAEWQCIDGVVDASQGETHVKVIPMRRIHECLAGPDVVVDFICLALWDWDVDGDVDLRDWSMANHREIVIKFKMIR